MGTGPAPDPPAESPSSAQHGCQIWKPVPAAGLFGAGCWEKLVRPEGEAPISSPGLRRRQGVQRHQERAKNKREGGEDGPGKAPRSYRGSLSPAAVPLPPASGPQPHRPTEFPMAAWRPQEEKQREAGEKRSLSAEAFPASLGRAPPMAGQCKAGLRGELAVPALLAWGQLSPSHPGI